MLDTYLNNTVSHAMQTVKDHGLRSFTDNIQQKDLSSEAIDKAAQDFEAVFLSTMFNLMYEGMEVDPVFGGGKAETIYRSMLLDQYASNMTGQHSIGIADSVRRQMLKLQEVGSND